VPINFPVSKKRQKQEIPQDIPFIVFIILRGVLRACALIFMLDYKRFVALLTFVASIITVFLVPADERADMSVQIFEIAVSGIKSTYIMLAVISVLILVIIFLICIIRAQAYFSGTSVVEFIERMKKFDDKKKKGENNDKS